MSARELQLAKGPTLNEERATGTADAAKLLSEGTPDAPGLGFAALDPVTGPFLPGQLWFTLARPGLGKTTFALGVACNWRRRGFVYFGTEEQGASARLRYAAMLAGVHPGAAVAGELDMASGRRVAMILGELAKEPVYFRDCASPSLRDVLTAAREAKDLGVNLVLVDHLHRMALPDSPEQRAALETVVRALKNVALGSQITLLVMGQAKRPMRKLDRYRMPGLSDGLGSSAIEQEGDVVLGLYRPFTHQLSKGDEHEVESGDVPPENFLQPGAMGVGVLKFRRNGDRVGERRVLRVEAGRVE